MIRGLRHKRFIALLCLLLFQLQVFAASTLGCAHNDAGAGAVHCMHGVLADDAPADHAQHVDQAGDATGAPCQKCSLGHCAAGWHLLADALEPSLPRYAPVQTAGSACHFYHFTPDGWLKPPIRLLSRV